MHLDNTSINHITQLFHINYYKQINTPHIHIIIYEFK